MEKDSNEDSFIGFSPPTSPSSEETFAGFPPVKFAEPNFAYISLMKIQHQRRLFELERDKWVHTINRERTPDIESQIETFHIEMHPPVEEEEEGEGEKPKRRFSETGSEKKQEKRKRLSHPGLEEAKTEEEGEESVKSGGNDLNNEEGGREGQREIKEADKEPEVEKMESFDAEESLGESVAVKAEEEVEKMPVPDKPEEDPEKERERKLANLTLPWKHGWKREINLKPGGADIVYIHPLGLRLKDEEDLSQHLTDGLTMENFSFAPNELKTVPEFEIIVPMFPEPEPAVRKSSRRPVPSSNYKIVEKLEEQKRKSVDDDGKRKLVIKLKQTDRKPARVRGKPRVKENKRVEKLSPHTCSVGCVKAKGVVPELTCSVCLCMYHPECVDLGVAAAKIHNYVCVNCRKPEVSLYRVVQMKKFPKVRKPTAAPPLEWPAVPQLVVSLKGRTFIVVPNNSTPPALPPQEKPKRPQTPHTAMQKACDFYNAMLKIFRFLPRETLGNAARVCRMWRDLAAHASLWRKIVLQRPPKDWPSFMDAMGRGQTKYLDLRALKPEEIAADLCVPSLEEIFIGGVPVDVLDEILSGCEGLKTLCVTLTKPGEFRFIRELRFLTDLTLCEVPGATACSLTQELPDVLASLTSLRSIRLEMCKFCPTEALSALTQLPNLGQLELINFEGTCASLEIGFAKLKNLKSLLIIPDFQNQSGSKITAMLKGIYKLHASLTEFAWVVTKEFLQVTELYTSKIRKEATSEGCIPILTPIPIAEDTSRRPEFWQSVPKRYTGDLFAVVPLTELQEMIALALPNTKTIIAKAAFEDTPKQTLRRLLP